MNVTELNFQGNRKAGSDHMWGLHLTGCSDIGNEVAKHGAMITNEYEVGSLREALDLVLDGEVRSLGWNDDNVYVAPCVKSGKPVTPKTLKPGVCAGSGKAFDDRDGRSSRNLYRPCPVCHRLYGTGRGVVPTHKEKSA